MFHFFDTGTHFPSVNLLKEYSKAKLFKKQSFLSFVSCATEMETHADLRALTNPYEDSTILNIQYYRSIDAENPPTAKA